MGTPPTTPFEYGATVNHGAFTNRRKDLERLKGNMAGGISTILISPRRWGKSSLVAQAAIELEQEHRNARVAVLDMFACGSLEEFLENMSRAVLAATASKWEEQARNAKAFFQQVAPRITIGNDMDPGISIGFDWKQARKHAGDILDMPERIAKAKKLRLVVCVDEFQHMINWHDDLKAQKLMRAHWQRHKHVTYVLYGSKRHMMAGLFDHGGMPFYRFGDIIWLERIALGHWTPWLVERFRSSGKSIAPELAETLARTVGCHSWYVQQLAHFLWSRTRRKADREGLEGALNLVIDSGTPLYQLLCEGLSATAINLLKAIANGERQLTSAAVMHEYRLGTPRNVQKTREALEHKDIIDRTPEGYSFLDPVFELWFKREFLRRKVGLAE